MGTADMSKNEDQIEKLFELVRLALSQTIMLTFHLLIHFGLWNQLTVELFTTNLSSFVQIMILLSVNISLACFASVGLSDNLATMNRMNSMENKIKRASIHFDNKPLQVLGMFGGNTHGLWSALYEVKAMESSLSDDEIHGINKRLDDVFALLNEYLLMNSVGRKVVEEPISEVMGVVVEELKTILVTADKLRISRIERKVERMIN